VTPAITVKRFSDDNMSVSLSRQVGATVDDFEADTSHPAALRAETRGTNQQRERLRRSGWLALTLGTVTA
jgi:hypothetical protein